jgi:tRNA(Ile)-lysidine synthase
VLVAVSGGADSTALLVGLARVAHEFDLQLTAAHLNHGLRGADADRDLDGVRALCARLGVSLIAAAWDTRRRMRSRGLSGEAGLRTLRREFLARAAHRARAVAIATAHTADDQLETVLMRLVRGTGIAGLGAMAPRCGRWIKPLLGATRRDIETDLRRARIEWREDASNQDRAYFRNRIRLDVIPALVTAASAGARPAISSKALDPGVATLTLAAGPPTFGDASTFWPRDGAIQSRLARNATAAATEIRSASGILKQLAGRRLNRDCRVAPGEFRLDSRKLATYPLALRRSLFRQLWKRIAPISVGLTRRHLESLDGLLGTPRGRSGVELPGGILAWRDRNWLYCRRRSSATHAGAVREVSR